ILSRHFGRLAAKRRMIESSVDSLPLREAGRYHRGPRLPTSFLIAVSSRHRRLVGATAPWAIETWMKVRSHVPQGESSMAMFYVVPSPPVALAQPSGMACWATVYTMMISWKNQTQYEILTAISAV